MSTRIVTPEQYREGYWTKVGDYKLWHSFDLISKELDGNYLVRDPAFDGKPLYAEANKEADQ